MSASLAVIVYPTALLRFVFIPAQIFALCLNVSAQSQQLKPYTPEDLVRMEEIGESALSPDGELLAYVVKRAKAAGPVESDHLNNNERADIWLASLKTRTTKNLTNGLDARAGHFAPRWSPDGERLAMLSIKDGQIGMMIWTRSTQKLEPMLATRVVPVALENFQEPYCWISNRELVMVTETQPIQSLREVMLETWTKLREGRESTASVLDSGVPADLDKRPQRQLITVDIISKEERTIATAAGFGQLLLSPDGQRLAFLKQVDVWRPDSNVDQITTLDPVIYQLIVADLPGGKTVTLTGVVETLLGSLLWSPDSTALAAIGYEQRSSERQTIFNCQIAEATCNAVSNQFPDLDPYRFKRFVRPPLTWMSTGEILLNSRQDHQHGQAPRNRIPEWWAVDESGKHRRLIRQGNSSPTQILPEVGTPHLIAVINSQLYRIGNDGEILKQISSEFRGKITSIVWSDTQSNVTNLRTRRLTAVSPVEKLLIAEIQAGLTESARVPARTDITHDYELATINIKSGVVEPFAKPATNAVVMACDADKGVVTLFADDDTGTYIWASSSDTAQLTPVVAINTFLKGIALPKQMKFEYRSSDGAQLIGWMILPTHYQEGRRYPLIVFPYPGRVLGHRRPYSYFQSYFVQMNPFDLRLLAARGYIVMLPSMPLRPYGDAEDPYMELTKGVLPAVDKLVGLGIADPDRVGLMGHSYGGYATYGLITQTKRFRAAVAGGGLTNMTSLFGVFHMEQRYESNGHENLMRMWNVETIAMAGPPWKDFGRYIRNSPVNYVERVETPLLILHGDLDTAAQLEQAEEFFTSLYRQNKRARFVRYLGEGHGLSQSAANIRNLWDQIFSWFDEFLRPQ